MTRIAHIINPVNAPEGSELHIAQPIVFASMHKAQQQSVMAEVSLYTTQYPEDHAIIPDWFTKLPDLQRSVLDCHRFVKKRKLPLITDILETLYQNTEAEYLVFTNADIILQPFFYDAVAELIAKGHDSLIITRRRIQSKYTKPSELPLIYAEVGMSHPGYDCFVFHRSLFQKLILGYVCVGMPFIEATLTHNLWAFSDNSLTLDDKHLTIHLGMEVMPKRDQDYYWYNRKQFNKIVKQLKPHLSEEKLPYADEPWNRKMMKRALNPSVFTHLSAELEMRSKWEQFKYRMNNIRFQILQKK